jgi:hypothetical protein
MTHHAQQNTQVKLSAITDICTHSSFCALHFILHADQTLPELPASYTR